MYSVKFSLLQLVCRAYTSCFSWANGIVKSLEVNFILINTGVRNTPYGVFGVDLKNSTTLKIILPLPDLQKVGLLVARLNCSTWGRKCLVLWCFSYFLDATIHCAPPQPSLSPLPNYVFAVSSQRMLSPVCCSSLLPKPPPSYSISLKNRTKHHCNHQFLKRESCYHDPKVLTVCGPPHFGPAARSWIIAS